MSEMGFSPAFDTPGSLPGYNLNATVPGATVSAGPLPIVGALVGDDIPRMSTDSIATAVNAGQIGSLVTDTNAIGPNLLSGIGSLNGPSHTSPVAPVVQPGGAQGNLNGPNPSQLNGPPQQQQEQSGGPVSMPGYLAATVPGGDSSLISAVSSAASSAGPQAALMAATVQIMSAG